MLAMAATAVMFCRRTSCPDCRLPWICRAAFPDIGIAMLPLPPTSACSPAIPFCLLCDQLRGLQHLDVEWQGEQRSGMR